MSVNYHALRHYAMDIYYAILYSVYDCHFLPKSYVTHYFAILY